jgi:hypothetical protein
LSVIACSSACFWWSFAICVANTASASSKLLRLGPTTYNTVQVELYNFKLKKQHRLESLCF